MINSITQNQLEKVKKITKFAMERTAFYQKKFSGINVDQLCSLNLLPLTKSIDLFKESRKFKSSTPFYKICASSGTLGNPKLMFRTMEDFESSVFNQILLMQKSEISRYNSIAIVQPFGFWGYGEITQIAAMRLGLEIFPLNDISDSILLNVLIDYNIQIVDISPSRLKSLIKLAVEQETINNLSIKIILCSGEKLENGFLQKVCDLLNCKVFNHYGSEETDALGYSLANSTLINLLETDFVYEVLNDDDEYVSDGEVGRLVITALNLYGTPLIRYDIGDKVKIINLEQAIVEIIGRTNEGITIHDSVKLYPFQIDEVLCNFINDEDLWQCKVYDFDNVVNLKFSIITENQIDTNTLEHELSNASIDIFQLSKGNKMKVEVSICNDLKLSSTGKNHRIIDLR